ncbi:MAG: carboxypeptidase regulatory-like domain-containing protein, partial [Acidobacteria bacterium]|nr:carboxypeptidase regulatory-like domain-containing protein [Acidobacteriota bacterium]
MPNAKLSLKNAGTGQSTDIQSDAKGNYRIGGLTPGEYEISASAEGFKPKTAKVQVGGTGSTGDIFLERST